MFAPHTCLAQGGTPAGQPTAAPVERALSDFLSIVLGADGAVGVDAKNPGRHTFFGGLKIGLPVAVKGKPPADVLRTVTLDLGYDRTQSRGGFSGELSMMLPMGRFPSPRTEEANYIRIYVEPGAGYRLGAGGLGRVRQRESDARRVLEQTADGARLAAVSVCRDPASVSGNIAALRRHPHRDSGSSPPPVTIVASRLAAIPLAPVASFGLSW